MRLLAIETSCDETAVAVLEAEGQQGAQFKVLGNALLSQIEIHKQYGGVYPAMAKRAHAKNLTPLLTAALTDAGMLTEGASSIDTERIKELLSREYELFEALSVFLSKTAKPDIDAIAVTHGPGLEPALWVGVNFAQALSIAWDVPIVPIDHMEGHFFAALVEGDMQAFSAPALSLPVLGLLVSGGHTELLEMHEWLSYKLLGTTRDDAVGEAFDKVARMLGLPYPGGPEISRLADIARASAKPADAPTLPRPMINSPDLDFSYSGLKTAVLYMIKGRDVSEEEKILIAREFEDAAIDVLYAKTSRALEQTDARTLAVGGGVSANAHLRRFFTERLAKDHPDVVLRFPPSGFTGDNAIMIGVAGFYRASAGQFGQAGTLTASGALALHI